MSGTPPFSAYKIYGLLLPKPSKRSLDKSMDFNNISDQNCIRKACYFLYIIVDSEISKSVDINDISRQKGV